MSLIWAHDFANDDEVAFHLDLNRSAVKADPKAPGGYTLNRPTVYGVHDPRLNAFRVSGQPTSSGFAMEIRSLGGRLAEPMDATQMYAVLTDASKWPDPQDVPARFYFVVAHATDSATNPIAPNTLKGPKGAKECLVVSRVVGNTVYFAGRGCNYSEANATGGIAPKAFLAGTVIGKDNHGGWGRCFSALDAASSGRGVADEGSPKRSKLPRSNVTTGYYADPFYHTHPEFAGTEFDGEEFHIQFRCYIDPNRLAPDVEGGKLFFIDPHAGGGQQQIVGSGPSHDDATVGIFGDFGAERYAPSNLYQPITRPDGTTTSNFPTCKVNKKVGCYQWPGDWFTVNIRVRPGLTMDAAVPTLMAGDDSADAFVVDTTHFAPSNKVEADGKRRLRFETTLPPLFRYLPATFNRHSPGYFSNGGWVFDWPTTSNGATWPKPADQFSGGTALCEGCEIVGDRMRWSFVQKGTSPLATGVPSNGHKMQMDVFDRLKAFPPEYRKHEVDLWVKPDGGEPVQVYGIAKYIVLFGTGANKFFANPPAYNEIKLTGYANVWDNLPPHPTCTFYRFGDVKFGDTVHDWPEF